MFHCGAQLPCCAAFAIFHRTFPIICVAHALCLCEKGGDNGPFRSIPGFRTAAAAAPPPPAEVLSSPGLRRLRSSPPASRAVITPLTRTPPTTPRESSPAMAMPAVMIMMMTSTPTSKMRLRGSLTKALTVAFKQHCWCAFVMLVRAC